MTETALESSRSSPEAARGREGLSWARLRSDPAVMLSLGYLALVAVGGTYRALYFRKLGINIFDYAQVSDFLIAAFRDPLTLLFSLGSLLVVWAANLIEAARRKRFPKWKGILSGIGPRSAVVRVVMNVVVVVFYFFYFASTYASYSVRRVREGRTDEVELIPVAAGTVPGGEVERPHFVGQTSTWVFVYRMQDKRLVAVPISNVGSLVRRAP